MNRHQRLAFRLLAVAALSGAAFAGSLDPPGPPAPTMKPLDQVEPRKPILPSQLPLTISQAGSYYLTGDVNTVGGGVTIDSDNVTLDLMGYTLYGGAGNGVEVTCCGRTGIAVRNGTIAHWSAGGLALSNAVGTLVEHVRAVDNGTIGIDVGSMGRVVRCYARQNGTDGIHVGADGAVERCTASSNTGNGIRTDAGAVIEDSLSNFNGGSGIVGYRVIVKDSAVRNNTGIGIWVAYSSVVAGCTSSWNGSTGIQAESGSRVEGSTSQSNGADGILAGYDTVIVGNVADGNGRLGDGAGVHVMNVSGCRVEENNVTNNDRGIYVFGTVNVVVKNTARGNSTEYDITPGNLAGAIATDPVGAGPWDNFDF